MNKVFSVSHPQAPYKVKNTFIGGVFELSRAVFRLTQGFTLKKPPLGLKPSPESCKSSRAC
jgi:hypothetical protein